MDIKHFSGEYPARDNPRLYHVWKAMRKRCRNPNDTYFHLYGGRGIKVCDEWQNFKNFLKWATENGYDKDAPFGKCTIDRIDHDGDYCPENCRLVDMTVQNRNKSSNHYLTYKGETKLATEWANELGIPLSTISVRLKRGYSIERALDQRRWIRSDATS